MHGCNGKILRINLKNRTTKMVYIQVTIFKDHILKKQMILVGETITKDYLVRKNPWFR